MRRAFFSFQMLLAIFGFCEAILPAEPPSVSTSPAPARAQYFSGFVAEMTPGSLAVTRKGAGKEVVRRVFLIDRQTKVEGKLHANARVTVRFESGSGGDRAVRIIVR